MTPPGGFELIIIVVLLGFLAAVTGGIVFAVLHFTNKKPTADTSLRDAPPPNADDQAS